MKLTIHGPNLNDQTKGTFHVHTAACRDNKWEVTVNGSDMPITDDFATVEDVAEYIYSDQIAESENDLDFYRKNPDEAAKAGYTAERLAEGVRIGDYVADFHFAPCTKKLPSREKPAAAKPKPAAKKPAAKKTAAAAKTTAKKPAAKTAAKKTAAKPKSAEPKTREPLKLPKSETPAKLVLRFLTERATADADAGGQGRPFITAAGKAVIAGQWFRVWLDEQLAVSVGIADAGAMLRDLGFVRRHVPVVGASSPKLWCWVADAPRGAGQIARMPAPVK